jgi:hypothetical protein
MKNKGRKHLAGVDSSSGSMNQKGCLTHVTRPVTSMSPNGYARSKFDKKKWIKRIRGYWKSQTKDII